jgi:hypothetical protein
MIRNLGHFPFLINSFLEIAFEQKVLTLKIDSAAATGNH